MSSIACPRCLSFNPTSAHACAQCGATLRPRSRLWLLLVLTLCTGSLALAWRMRERLRTWLPQPAPTLGSEPARPVEPEVPLQAEPDPRAASVPSVAPAPSPLPLPTIVAVAPFDGDGVALPPTVACPIEKDTIALPMACVRGAVSIDVQGTTVTAVSGYQEDVVLVTVPGLKGSTLPLSDRQPSEGESVLVFAASGAAGADSAAFVRAARDVQSRQDRLVITRASFPCGAVLENQKGQLAGLFLGPSSDGQGIVLPPSRIDAALKQRQYLALTQLKIYFHDQNAFSRRELGLTYVKLGRHAQAIDELVRAIELEPGYREDLKSLLVSLFRTHASKLHDERRDEEAKAVVERGLREYPNQPDFLRDQGVIQLALGDTEGAVWSLRQAQALGAEDPQDVQELLERALLSAGRDAHARHDVAGAIRYFEDGAATFPQSGLLRFELGGVYAEAGFLQDALNAYLEAQRLEPSIAAQAEAAAERIRQSLTSSGGVEIHFPPGSKSIRTVMRLNDRISTEVIVDTGASTSVITRKVAERLHLSADGPQVEVLTAGGRIRAPVGRLRSAAIGGAVVHDLEVVIVDLPDWDGTGGLVGLNFLDRFQTSIDFQRGVLTLAKR